MKWLFTLLTFLSFTFLHAQTLSPPINPPPPPFLPPPNDILLPIVLINNSGMPDEQVYIVVTGVDLNPGPGLNSQAFVSFSAGIGTLKDLTPSSTPPLDPTQFAYPLSSFPVASGGHVIYVPYISSALIYFSLGAPLTFGINGNAIIQPNFLDPNLSTIFDIFEFAYLKQTTPASLVSVSVDATAVTFFGMPLYGYLSTATTEFANTGLYQPRSFILSQVAQVFKANATNQPEQTQWMNLFFGATGQDVKTAYRILSPGKAMSPVPALFDPNYLDNQAAYTYSYIADIWSSMTSFYRANPLMIKTPFLPGFSSGETYQGVIQGDNSILFHSTTTPANQVTFLPPTPLVGTSNTNTTTYNIFSGLNLFNPDTTPPALLGDATQLSKLFEEAIVTGIVPATNTIISQTSFQTTSAFYLPNNNLTGTGKMRGPWYDLYSKGLHSLGSIYTYAYDDEIWPNVLLSSPLFTPGQTYLAVTIGPLQQALSSTVNLTVLQNGQTAIYTAFVGGSAAILPTGIVTFNLDGVEVGIVPLVNSQAVFQFLNLTPGSHTITASYSGDENYLPSSDTMTLFVNVNPTPAPIPMPMPIPQVQVAAPTDLRVIQVKNRFAIQTELVNIITWKAPATGNPPVAYKIYRNAQLTDLIATVQGGRLRFEDHNRRKGRSYSYFIVSIDAAGQVSSPAEVVFRD